MNNELAVALNGYLANLNVAYVKLHNLHWNVVGMNFKAIHEYLESLYDGLAESVDSVAELVKMGGGIPAASMKEYLELADVKELPSVERPGADVLSLVLADFELMRGQAERIRDLADGAGSYAVVDAMEGDLGHYNKAIWFIRAMMK